MESWFWNRAPQFWNQMSSFGILVLESNEQFWNRGVSFGILVLESCFPVLESGASFGIGESVLESWFWNRVFQFWNRESVLESMSLFWNPGFGIGSVSPKPYTLNPTP